VLIRYLTIVRTCTYCRRPCRTADESHTGRRRRVWFESERSKRKGKKLKSVRKAGMWKEGKRPPGSRNALPRSFRFPTGRHPHLWGDGRMDRSAYNFSAASGNGRVIHNCISRLPMCLHIPQRSFPPDTTRWSTTGHRTAQRDTGPRQASRIRNRFCVQRILPPSRFLLSHSFPAYQELYYRSWVSTLIPHPSIWEHKTKIITVSTAAGPTTTAAAENRLQCRVIPRFALAADLVSSFFLRPRLSVIIIVRVIKALSDPLYQQKPEARSRRRPRRVAVARYR